MIYLKNLEIISDVHPIKAGLKIQFEKPICFLVGENGIGKTTIFECLGDYFGKKDDTYLKRNKLKEPYSGKRRRFSSENC